MLEMLNHMDELDTIAAKVWQINVVFGELEYFFDKAHC